MLVNKFVFRKSFFFILFLILSVSASAQSNEWEEAAAKKMEDIQKMEERMNFIKSYLLNVENLTEQQKGWLRESFDLKARTYLLYENKSGLKKLSPRIYDNTLCLARNIGPQALVYINVAVDQFFKTPEEKKRYKKASAYLETLDTPNYSEEKIKEMCKL